MSRLDATCSLACTYVGIGQVREMLTFKILMLIESAQENARMSMLALVGQSVISHIDSQLIE